MSHKIRPKFKHGFNKLQEFFAAQYASVSTTFYGGYLEKKIVSQLQCPC